MEKFGKDSVGVDAARRVYFVKSNQLTSQARPHENLEDVLPIRYTEAVEQFLTWPGKANSDF